MQNSSQADNKTGSGNNVSFQEKGSKYASVVLMQLLRGCLCWNNHGGFADRHFEENSCCPDKCVCVKSHILKKTPALCTCVDLSCLEKIVFVFFFFYLHFNKIGEVTITFIATSTSEHVQIASCLLCKEQFHFFQRTYLGTDIATL